MSRKDSMPRKPNISLTVAGIILLVANALLLFIVIPAVSSRMNPAYGQDKYADGYDQLADNLAEGNGYRFYPETALTMMREPGYPVLLAGLQLAFGKSFLVVKAANMCLALTTAWLLTLITRRLSCNPWSQLIPSVLFLFHPGTLVAESRGGVEILFTFLIVLFMVGFFRAAERSRWWLFAGCGGILGLAVLVKSTPLLFPVFLLAYLVATQWQRRWAAVAQMACMAAALLAVLSPWIARNFQLTGRFVPTASVFGVSAQAGEYICAHRSEGKPMWVLDREAAFQRSDIGHRLGYQFRNDYYYQTFYRSIDELTFSSVLTQRVFAEYRQNPLLCLKCVSGNFINFWFAGRTEQSTLTNVLVQLPYLILGGVGLVLGLRNSGARVLGPLVLFMAYFMSVYVPILAQARYSMPLIPFVSVLGGISIAAIRERLSSRARLRVRAASIYRKKELMSIDQEKTERAGVLGLLHEQGDRQ